MADSVLSLPWEKNKYGKQKNIIVCYYFFDAYSFISRRFCVVFGKKSIRTKNKIC